VCTVVSHTWLSVLCCQWHISAGIMSLQRQARICSLQLHFRWFIESNTELIRCCKMRMDYRPLVKCYRPWERCPLRLLGKYCARLTILASCYLVSCFFYRSQDFRENKLHHKMRQFKWIVSEIKKRYSFAIRLSVVTEVLKYFILQTILLIVQYIACH